LDADTNSVVLMTHPFGGTPQMPLTPSAILAQLRRDDQISKPTLPPWTRREGITSGIIQPSQHLRKRQRRLTALTLFCVAIFISNPRTGGAISQALIVVVGI
jgi:hypothetical protein